MLTQRRLFYFLLGLTIILLGPAQSIRAQQNAAASTRPMVLKADARGLELEWVLPQVHLSSITAGGQRYSQADIPGLPTSGEPGSPELPSYSHFVGLPADGEATARVLEIEQETAPLSHPPLPSPVPEPVHLALTPFNNFPTAGPTARTPDPAIYAADTLFPASVAALADPEWLRGHRLARLTISPVQVNPVSGEMVVTRRIRLAVIFSQPGQPAVASQPPGRDTPFERALSPALLNPQAATWLKSSTALAEKIIPRQTIGNITKILVAEAGLYSLAYSDLVSAGVPVESLDPRTFKLKHGYPRQEVAIEVQGQADGIFNSGDRVLFYAQPDLNRYAAHDVYFLEYGGANGLRMSSRSGNPDNLAAGTAWRTILAEENHFYDSLYAGRDGDHWYWDDLRQPNDTAGSYAIWLENPLIGGPNATLTLWLRSYTGVASVTPDHHVNVSFNGAPLGSIVWDGVQVIEHTFHLPGGILQNGSNQLELSLPGAGTLIEGAWVDAFEIGYPTNQAGQSLLHFQGGVGALAYTLSGWQNSALSVYDVTTPHNPQRIEGFSFNEGTLTFGAQGEEASYLIARHDQIKSPPSLLAAKPFTAPQEGADYIMITHPSFAPAVAPLAAHRTAQGLRVITVDVEAIYDNFGTGRTEPEAIKTFLKEAYEQWPAPAPLYVLLVGDGSYDFRNYSGWNPQMFIPPYLAQVDPWMGETASDNRYVTLAGNDNLPDMLIGRLAVNSITQANTVVDKIIRYETDPIPGGWNANHLFVSDDPDHAGNFHANANLAYDALIPPYAGQRYYFAQPPGSKSYEYTDANALRDDFKYRFNQGAGMITFHGHSSWHQWAVEALFRWSLVPEENDVTSLLNGLRLPFVFEMTCFTGYFHHPEYPTMDESLLRHNGGGAIAVWGSTGLGVATGHDVLQDRFYYMLLEQGETNLGALLLHSKLGVSASGLNQDLIDTYTLFGDPALTLDVNIVPFEEYIFLPVVSRLTP